MKADSADSPDPMSETIKKKNGAFRSVFSKPKTWIPEAESFVMIGKEMLLCIIKIEDCMPLARAANPGV